ncbi:hypothetical protein D3C75_514260 [compost metagenome]
MSQTNKNHPSNTLIITMAVQLVCRLTKAIIKGKTYNIIASNGFTINQTYTATTHAKNSIYFSVRFIKWLSMSLETGTASIRFV